MNRAFALVAVALAGCSPSTPASDFSGTWSLSRGGSTVSCDGGSTVSTAAGSLVVTAGDTADLQATLPDGCVLSFNIVETQARALPEQSCTLNLPDGSSQRIDVQGATLNLNGNHTSILAEIFATQTSAGGAAINACGLTVMEGGDLQAR